MAFDFHAVADASPALIWVADVNKLCIWFNRGWLEFTGRRLDQELGHGWAEGVHPDDRARCMDAYITHFDAREPFLLEYRLRRRDGEYRWLLDSGTPRYDARGQFLGYNGICFDIQDRKQYEELQRAQSEFINAVLDCGPECVKVVSASGDLILMSRAGLDMLEVDSLEEARQFGLIHFVVPAWRDAFFQLHREVITGQRGTLAFEITGRNGTRRWLETHAAPLRDKAGAVMALVGVTRDITEHRALLARLEHQATTDSLTGLPNRAHFFTLAEREFNRIDRYGGELSLLMLDIDHFKQINDQFGHKAGDQALATFARICRDTLRDVDIIGRLGGEEFAILLPETPPEQAIEVAQRLRQAIAESVTSLPDGRTIAMTASVGLASRGLHPGPVDDLLQLADRALYAAKRAGRNCVIRETA